MSSTSGNQGARGDAVKQEEQQLQLTDARHPRAFDLKETRERGDNIKLTISEFSLAFVVTGAHPPIVLHFSICDWAAAFKAELLKHGLCENAAWSQISATLAICLAAWSKNVSTSQVCIALKMSQRWLLEPCVKEDIRSGYFLDTPDPMEKILRVDARLPA